MKTKINHVSILLTIVLVWIGVTAQEVKEVNAPYTLTIEAPKQIRSGSDMTVKVSLTNISEHKIGVELMGPTAYLSIIRGPSGIAAPATEKGRTLISKQRERLDPNYGGTRVGHTLEPGESLEEKFEASDFFEMKQTGAYSIQLVRMWHKTRVQSNTITVEVVP